MTLGQLQNNFPDFLYTYKELKVISPINKRFFENVLMIGHIFRSGLGSELFSTPLYILERQFRPDLKHVTCREPFPDECFPQNLISLICPFHTFVVLVLSLIYPQISNSESILWSARSVPVILHELNLLTATYSSLTT